MVLSAAEDATIRLWRPDVGNSATAGGAGSGSAAAAATATLLHTFRGHGADVNAVDCGSTPTSAGTFATGSSDGTARIWDLASGKWSTSLSAAATANSAAAGAAAAPSADTAVTGVALSPDSMLLATGGMDGTVRLYVDQTTQTAI